MKNLLTLILTILTVNFAVAAHEVGHTADQSKSTTSKSGVYSGVFGGGNFADDFDGFLVGGVIGKNLTGPHNIDLEFIYSEMDSSTKTTNALVTTTGPGGTTVNNGAERTKGKLKEYMILLNYRYKKDLDSEGKWPFYIGAGVGIDFTDIKTNRSLTLNPVGTTFSGTSGREKRNSDIEAVGQLFTGIGYQITDTAALSLGGRLFVVSREYKARNGFINNATVAKTGHVQLAVQGMLSFKF